MIYDFNTGELINDKFAQLYFKDIQKLFNLSGTDIKVLLLMSKAIGLGNSGSINMTPKRKKEFAKQLNLKNHQQITNSLNKLMLADVIKKKILDDRFDYEYTINPDILFSGNDYQRAKILIEYSDGKRNVKAFPTEEALIRYIARQEEENMQ